MSLKGGETLVADLVVDTSGRGSKVTSWLKDGGYEAPRSVEVNPNVSYYSTVFEAPQEVRALARRVHPVQMLGWPFMLFLGSKCPMPVPRRWAAAFDSTVIRASLALY